MEIQDLVKRLRAEPNLSAFARRSNVSRATLYRLLDGWCNPTFEVMRKIEMALSK